MAVENDTNKKQTVAVPYPGDIPLSTMAQNVDIEELLMTRLETELLDPLMDHNKIKIRLKEMSAINLEITHQLDEYRKTGKSGRSDPIVQKVGAANARARAIVARAAEILNGGPVDDSKAEASVDNPPTKEEDQAMSTPTREEIDAKLKTLEITMVGHVKSIEATISGFVGRQEERFGRLDDRLVRMEQSTIDTQADIKGLKSTIIITAISTVLAIVLGVAAFNATVLSNMVASFESGKNTAIAQAEVKKQSEDTAALIKRMQEDLDARRAAEAAKSQK